MKKIICTLLATLFLTSFSFAQDRSILDPMLDQISADSLHQTVLDLQNFGSRFALREGGNKQVAEYIRQRMENYGITAVIDSFYQEGYNWLIGEYGAWFYNVKGTLTAADPIDDSLVIIGAHLDAISLNAQYQLQTMAPGADDNASGIATMLEVARVLHNNPQAFRRTVIFMGFDGEELGLYGAHHAAEQHEQNHDKIAVMLNNDMVSFQPDDDWRVTLHWYDNALDVLEKAATVCRTFTDIDPYIPDVTGNGNSRASDSYAYATHGFKAVFAIEYTFSTSYHTEHDVADSNNYAYHAHITRYNLAMLYDYAMLGNVLSITDRPTATKGTIYPNPVSDKAVLHFTLEEPCQADLLITNMAGQIVSRQSLNTLDAGAHYVNLNLSNLSSGIYLCRFQSDKVNWTEKIVVK